ncbi:MAG TPA: 3-deoxy-manno-octulosonate cytidylyltransferase [Nitrospirota bacterium]|nr:3-deoxy-manno-octulosonate cytidylyltransferase [Nitrospirota bacterium]
MKKTPETVIALIPARYGSTRFPGKSLVMIKGKSMIQRVYERARQSRLIARVVVATDDERILRTVTAFGGEAVMTSPDHATGTDRIAEVAGKVDCSLVVNVQGDEPVIHPEMIDQAITPMVGDPSIPMSTVCKRIETREEALDPNVVKVVFDTKGFALYFSRAPIPWDRDRWAGKDSFGDLPLAPLMYKHIGLYVYRRDFLVKYSKIPQTVLERTEKLEQLRALESGYRIKTVVTQHESFGVDIPEDLGRIMQHLEERRD